MAELNPINVIDGAITTVNPAGLGTAATTLINQVGTTGIGNALQNIAYQSFGSATERQAPFQKRKFVSFQLFDYTGAPIKVPTPNILNFQPGYLFNMYVNPKNFKISLPPKTVVPARTMGGWKVQYWYPEIGSISANGIIGNMLEQFSSDVKNSTAWFGFRQLMSVYQNNGVPFYTNGQQITRQQAQAQFSPTVRCIFDTFQYEGYFESLNYTEDEETPNTIVYDFSFKILSILDTSDLPSATRAISQANGIIASTINATVGNVVLPPSTTNSILKAL